jgi:hypothetical protein
MCKGKNEEIPIFFISEKCNSKAEKQNLQGLWQMADLLQLDTLARI